MTDQKQALFQAKMNEGHSAAWDQDWAAAAQAYAAALEIIPNNPQALTNLGLAYYQLQQYDEALAAYQRAVQAAPNDPIPYEKTGELSERLGHLKQAVTYFLKAAELHLKQRNIEKALENWTRVTRIDPENILAHSRLALAHERLKHNKQAAVEYLALASLVQRRGDLQRTKEFVQKAIQLDPKSNEARTAARIVAEGNLLPKPMRPKGGTGPLRMAKVKQLEAPKGAQAAVLRDPVSAAAQRALRLLADILFEISEENEAGLQARPGLKGLMRNTGSLQTLERNRPRIMLHLGQVIDSQTRNDYAQAAEELNAAIESGFEHPAADFDLGYLRFQEGRLESAQRALQRVLDYADFALAARLLLGQIEEQRGDIKAAAMEYLQALKLADAHILPDEQAAEVRALYDTVQEDLLKKEDEALYRRIVENVREMLLKPRWEEQLREARSELSAAHEGALLPLTELIIASQSAQVLEALQNINQLARRGFLRSAMEEAYYAISFAPNYLPLHTLVGDLLVQGKRLDAAMDKYKMVARSYQIRGESGQATRVLRKVVAMAPMDLKARSALIDALIKQNDYEAAIAEYINLADFHYRLAQLEQAQKTYSEALRLAQHHSRNHEISVHILERMADINLQRLDWKQALRMYEQIRSLAPDHLTAHRQVIDLNLRLAQFDRAAAELRDTLEFLEKKDPAEAIAFLEDLASAHGQTPLILHPLAERYARAGRQEEAINLLDALAEAQLNEGQREAAIATINRIIALNPPNVEQYRQVLASL